MKLSPDSKNALIRLLPAVAAIVLGMLATSAIFGQNVNIGGQDGSSSMKDVQNLLSTLQNIGFKWVAPLLGGGLAIIGIFQIATRRVGTGLLALIGGGALFVAEKIANSLTKIAG